MTIYQLTYLDMCALKSRDFETLAAAWCKLNCFEWVDWLADKPVAEYVKDKSKDRRGAVMLWIMDNVPMKYIDKAWAKRIESTYETVRKARQLKVLYENNNRNL